MRSEQQAKHFGTNAENFFRSKLNKYGIHYTFEDSWFDFLINNKYKVEVKSCQLTIADKIEKNKFRQGRFDFTNETYRKLQFKENIWIAFILRHESDFLLLGFTRSKYLKMKRYIPLAELRKISVVPFHNWILRVNRK